MYNILRIILPIGCIIGIIYIKKQEKYYQENKEEIEKDIIKYFKENNATSYETGIETKKVPQELFKNKYMVYILKYKTIVCKKNKCYLNERKSDNK